MIIWINGPFGGGKTTLANALMNLIPNSIIFDPEQIGFIIHKTVPESRSEDFQNFPMWREHVILFIKNFEKQFGKNLIIPMTLVNPEYINEIHTSLKSNTSKFYHYFLNIDETTLKNRITEQIMVPLNAERDQEIRQWRLDQVTRCLEAARSMPKDTVFLDSGLSSPNELAQKILSTIVH